MEQKPTVVFVLGGPGSGKGTQCDLIVKNFGFKHLSAGDLLREERASGSPDGELIEDYIRNGKIVPSEITVALLEKAMRKHGWDNGKFLIDGFPRNEENYQSWIKLAGEIETMEARIIKRSETSGRSDDNLEALKKRFVTYLNETMPIIEEFKKRGQCVAIKAEDSIETIFTEVSKAFSRI